MQKIVKTMLETLKNTSEYEAIQTMTNVFILEDQATTRLILSAYIDKEPTMHLACAAGTLAEGLEWLSSNAPDVMLVDLNLSDGEGFEAIHACVKKYPDCSILVLTGSTEVTDALASLYAGALGYVVKEHGLNRIVDSIKDMLAGGSPITPTVARKLYVEPLHTEAQIALGAKRCNVKLSDREAEVLKLLSKGLTYPEISKELNVKVSTVPEFIKRLYRKLEVNSRHQAVQQAKMYGLIM